MARSAALTPRSRRVSTNRLDAAILTTPFCPEHLVFELLSVIECQMAGSPAVVDRLPNEWGSKMACVRIAD